MPIHDWTRVDAGLFHAFHQRWISALSDVLNTGGLPPEFFALAEQSIRGPIPDVLTLATGSDEHESAQGSSPAVDVAVVPPRAKLIQESDLSQYARKADRLAVRHRHGRVVAVIEIVSPGNKASRSEFRAFVEKSADLIQQGVHVVVIDFFPDKQLSIEGLDGVTLVCADEGDDLPEIPLFLGDSLYVPLPLERSYEATWAVFPAALKGLLAS